MRYEMVAGLEVHIGLATQSKLFCGCPTAFGAPPNTQVCPVCTGAPGALPMLNKTAVEYAIRAGIALHSTIAWQSAFDRKSYFYPDLPKAYQITQIRQPLCTGGWLDIETDGQAKRVGIREMHIEEDAGKLTHRGGSTLVDFNRCGVPLLEIVTEPDFTAPEQITAFVEKLREYMLYLGVSDCKMQEGSLRVDLNLSVRPQGSSDMGTRTEIKNIGSIKALGRAAAHEYARQAAILQAGNAVTQQTRRWDEAENTGRAMRKKETAGEYRSLPEPDLPTLHISCEWVEGIRANMPELAEQKRARFIGEYGLPEYDAQVLTSAREWAGLFERTAAICGQPKEAANIIMGEVMRLCSEHGLEAAQAAERASAEKLAEIIGMVAEGVINRGVAKDVVERVFTDGAEPLEYVRANGLAMLRDGGEISAAVDSALAENAQAVRDYTAGKASAFGYLMGAAMKRLGGRADPQAVREALRERLDKL